MRQYTDVHNITVRCLVCGKGLAGPAETQKHAMDTGHINFSEVSPGHSQGPPDVLVQLSMCISLFTYSFLCHVYSVHTKLFTLMALIMYMKCTCTMCLYVIQHSLMDHFQLWQLETFQLLDGECAGGHTAVGTNGTAIGQTCFSLCTIIKFIFNIQKRPLNSHPLT